MKARCIRVLVLATGMFGLDAGAQGVALDATMQPIDKSTDTASRCLRCPAADAGAPAYERVTDRSAPEYAGERRASAEMQPAERLTGDVVGTATSLPLPLQLR